MYKLVVTLSGRTLNRYEFDQESVKIGRNADCEVHIDNLGVSRYHCEILRQAGVYVLRDLKSNNGTYVNGRRVDGIYNLNDGDEIALGKFTVGFSKPKTDSDLPPPPVPGGEDKAAGGDGADPATLDAEASGGRTMAIDARQMSAFQREKASKVKGFLILKTGGAPKQIFLEKSIFTAGKDDKADISLTGFFTPRRLAIIFRDENGFRLLNVSNKAPAGTKVNGKPVEDHRLQDGDQIEILDRKMQFMVGSPLR